MIKSSDNPFKPYGNEGVIERELAIEARSDALAEKPAASDVMLPSPVVAQRSQMISLYDHCVQVAQGQMQAIENRVDELKNNFSHQTLKNKADNSIDKLVSQMKSSDKKAKCDFHKMEFIRRKRDFERFKIDHSLIYHPQRGVQEDSFLGLSTAVWIVVALYLVEAIFNASLFVNEVGMVGGLTISLSSSLVNVVVGYFVGRFICSRMYLGKSLTTKVLSIAGFVAFMFTIVYMNLMIAMYRTLKAAENAFQVVNTSDAAWPFPHINMLDFNSALVLMVGFVFALVALLDGFFSDEPYPGYGHRYRLCLNERAEVLIALQEYKKDQLASILKCRDDVEKIFQDGGHSINEWGAQVNTVQRRFVDYSKWLQDLLETDKTLWDTYRSSHEEHRLADYVAPALFENALKPLFAGKETDELHVFRDASQLYMSDEERIEQMGKYQAVYDDAQAHSEERLDSEVAILRSDLIALEEKAVCHI